MTSPDRASSDPQPTPAGPNEEHKSASTNAPAQVKPRTRSTLLTVGIVVAIIVGSVWFVGERQGWGTIGQGGLNAQLLPRVGEEAPELFTLTADGQPVVLSQLRGQPVWINFWGSWCPPCRAEMPELQSAYEELAPQGLVMLGISMREHPADAMNYAEAAGATFPVLMDPSFLANELQDEFPEYASLVEAWQVNNFPTHIFIDREGIVRASILAQMDHDEAIEYGEMVLSDDPSSMLPVEEGTPGATTGATPQATPAASPAARRRIGYRARLW